MESVFINIYQRNGARGYGGIETSIAALNEVNGHVRVEELTLDSDGGAPYLLRNLAGCDIPTLSFYLKIRSLPVSSILIIHYPWPPAWLIPIFCYKASYIVYYHSDINRSYFLKALLRPLEWLFFRRAKALSFTSRQMRLLTNNRLAKCSPSSRTYVWSPMLKVADENFALQYSKIFYQDGSFYRSQIERNRFVFIGSHRSYKDLNTLLLAFKSLEGEGIYLDVLGDGIFYENNVRLAEALRLNNVNFQRIVTDEEKFFYLQRSNALILPSNHRSEAFGVVLLEAFATGTPVIVSNIDSPMPSIVSDGTNGYRFKASNADDLADKIRCFSNMGWSSYRDFCLSAHKTYWSSYARSVSCERIEKDLLKIRDNLN